MGGLLGIIFCGNSIGGSNNFVSRENTGDVDHGDVLDLGELEMFGHLVKYVRLNVWCFDFLSVENFLSRSNIEYNNFANYPL